MKFFFLRRYFLFCFLFSFLSRFRSSRFDLFYSYCLNPVFPRETFFYVRTLKEILIDLKKLFRCPSWGVAGVGAEVVRVGMVDDCCNNNNNNNEK